MLSGKGGLCGWKVRNVKDYVRITRIHVASTTADFGELCLLVLSLPSVLVCFICKNNLFFF